MVAEGAPSDDAGTIQVHMCFGEALLRPTVSTLSFSCCDIRHKYSAELAGGGITVEVFLLRHTHFGPPVEPKRSVLILSLSWPEAPRRVVTLSTKDVGPQT